MKTENTLGPILEPILSNKETEVVFEDGSSTLELMSFDYKPCPGACVSKLSEWITVNGLN